MFQSLLKMSELLLQNGLGPLYTVNFKQLSAHLIKGFASKQNTGCWPRYERVTEARGYGFVLYIVFTVAKIRPQFQFMNYFREKKVRFKLRPSFLFYLSTYNKQNNPDSLHGCKIEMGLYTGWDHCVGDKLKRPKTNRMENGTASVHICWSRAEDNKHNQYVCET